MRNRFKKVLLLIAIVLIYSCNDNSDRSQIIIDSNYFHVPFCHSIDISDSLNIPEKIWEISNSTIKNKLGSEFNKKIHFNGSRIISDTPLKIIEKRGLSDITLYGNDSITVSNTKKCEFPYNYPLYKIYYTLKLPEIGLDSLDLELIIDRNQSIIHNVAFPSYNHTRNELPIIPVDSVYSEINKRGISRKDLKIFAWYSYKKDAIMWSAETFINQGSVLGGGCLPNITYHFQMNSKTGNITNYSQDIRSTYFLDRYNPY